MLPHATYSNPSTSPLTGQNVPGLTFGYGASLLGIWQGSGGLYKKRNNTLYCRY